VSDELQGQRHLRVLYLEDSSMDAELVGGVLTEAGYELEMDVAMERARYEELLASNPYDVILADYRLPGFEPHAALGLARSACPETPYVCVSGTIGEEATAELLKQGADDCVLKDRLARLPFAVQRAIDQKTNQRDRRKAEELLTAAAFEWRRTFDAMRDSVAMFDRRGRVLRCNAATTVLTGRGFDDIVGRHCHEVFHDAHEYHSHCPQRRAFASGHVETTLMKRNGQWLRFTFALEIEQTGHVSGGVHVVTDVSELKQTEQRLRASMDKQQRVTNGVIAALSRSVELRDSYTAGHQRRVAELAVALARELGLDAESVRQIQVASMLHDIGKSVVPAEILSKFGPLSDIEFALIKTHPQAAYEILRSIEFDFPLAEIVVQHQERLDGSGYPAGLTEQAILPEARLLAVADVVEAMVSHRPYRAALSIEAALEEIKKHSGTLYDAKVVKACVTLFRKDGFAFERSGVVDGVDG
jgi:PAS domain S-box-containing protein/putative nucleotidyltransferase with HDIG domain